MQSLQMGWSAELWCLNTLPLSSTLLQSLVLDHTALFTVYTMLRAQRMASCRHLQRLLYARKISHILLNLTPSVIFMSSMSLSVQSYEISIVASWPLLQHDEYETSMVNLALQNRPTCMPGWTRSPLTDFTRPVRGLFLSFTYNPSSSLVIGRSCLDFGKYACQLSQWRSLIQGPLSFVLWAVKLCPSRR